MEYSALVMPTTTSTKKANSPALLAACGCAFAVGILFLTAAAPSFSAAYVQSRPAVAHRATAIGVQRNFGQNRASAAAAEAGSAVDNDVQPATVQNMVLPQSSGLSVAAIALSAAALMLALWRSLRGIPSANMMWSAAASLGEIMGMTKKKQLAMDEVALAIKEDQAKSKLLTPKDVVLELQRGNARFWAGMPERPEMNAMERRALIMAQAPMVCILSCADSRVPVEILFDQGLGRVFVVRVAGNILDATAMGSIEFSVKYLGVKVVLVMGHEACGAVKGAMNMSADDIDKQPAYLQQVLRSIKSNLDLNQLKSMRDSRAQDRQAIVTNTSSQVKTLQENKLIAERVANGSLLVCGAFYEITSGMVDFFTLDKNGLVIDV